MNVPTITMPVDVAQEHLDRYKAAIAEREATPEDEKILLGYKALAQGKQILDLHAAFRACPLDQKGHPCFAIGRAHWKQCLLRADWYRDRRAIFGASARHISRDGRGSGNIFVPRTSMPAGWNPTGTVRAIVPTIPLPIRPTGDLSRYHILWEAKWEPVAPIDPLLLKKLSGSLFVILAAWDLTELERAILAGRFDDPTA